MTARLKMYLPIDTKQRSRCPGLVAGALGARMVGGGFGGSAIALVKAQNVEKTKLTIQNAFTEAGYKAPRFFTSLPSQGARIL